MGQVGKFLRRTGAKDGHTAGGYAHWCPACNEMHGFAVDEPFRNGARWTFNGNIEKPTFSPSMNISDGPYPSGRFDRCHYFLRDGMLQFLPDCTHALAGQTLLLPELPEGYRDVDHPSSNAPPPAP